jgi:aspartate racemase
MKAIGVLGGIGPQATMDFEARVHAAARRLIPANANQGYPPLAVIYLRHAPILLADDGTPVEPKRLDPRLLDAARRLGAWADFLVVTSNGVHRWRQDIAAAAGRPVLSMIEATLDEVARRRWRTVGVLTFTEPGVYQQPLAARGLGCEVLDAGQQQRLDAVVLPFMAGQGGPAARATVRAAVDGLRARGVDGVILGCTELPLLLGPEAEAPDLINPTQLLAEAAVRESIG